MTHTNKTANKWIYIFVVFCLSFFGGVGMAIHYGPRAEPAARQSISSQSKKNYFGSIALEARSVIVYDILDDQVLFEKDADRQLPLASITKIALLYAIAPFISQNENISISQAAYREAEGGFPTPGSTWKARDLIDYTLITSSNVGAEALAETADPRIKANYSDAPDTEQSVWLMNHEATEMGLTHTIFTNPTGLDLDDTTAGAYSSARDLAFLFAKLAVEMPDLFSSTVVHEKVFYDKQGEKYTAKNTDDSLPAIPDLIMGKTGTTDLAGGNLAIVFDVGLSHPVGIVVLGSSDKGRFTDMETLLTATHKTLSD